MYSFVSDLKRIIVPWKSTLMFRRNADWLLTDFTTLQKVEVFKNTIFLKLPINMSSCSSQIKDISNLHNFCLVKYIVVVDNVIANYFVRNILPAHSLGTLLKAVKFKERIPFKNFKYKIKRKLSNAIANTERAYLDILTTNKCLTFF
jgi:hypothetical protein